MVAFSKPSGQQQALKFCHVLQTLATLASDPLASLVDTAFLGHYGQCVNP